jgi:glutaminyl-peptide cyclotransferase
MLAWVSKRRHTRLALAVVVLGTSFPLPLLGQGWTEIRRFPHDPNAFTQGLECYGGQLFESTGLEGESTLRRVDVESGEILQQVALPDTEFGEGLTRVEDRWIQLTWQEGIAHVYDVDSFEEIETFAYDGEGWGLCYDGASLVMSDGSSRLFFRDPATFELLGDVAVTLEGSPVSNLNELECVGAWVFANVWQTDRILMIDPATGEVEEELVMSGLLTRDEAIDADVLNGIAFLPAEGHFYVTGKLWPHLFELDLGISPERLGLGSSEPTGAGDAGQDRGRAGDSGDVEAPPPRGGCSVLAVSGSPGCGLAGHWLLVGLAFGLGVSRRRGPRQ